MLPSPRNVTSILSSILFVTDLYEVHPIIVQQLMSQIFYWLGTVLFNRIMDNRKYLARSRAMQIRLNVSAIEDWARANNRKPEDIQDEFHSGGGHKYPSMTDLCRKQFGPLVELLQWLQCFTAVGNDLGNVDATLQQLSTLNSCQLLHVANKYRAEVGEKGFSKEYKAYLSQLKTHAYSKETSFNTQAVNTTIHNVLSRPPSRKATPKPELDSKVEPKPSDSTNENAPKIEEKGEKAVVKEPSSSPLPAPAPTTEPVAPTTSHTKTNSETAAELADTPVQVRPSSTVVAAPTRDTFLDGEDNKPELFLDASAVLPFVIPTLTEMIVTWGAGLGGTQASRAKKYEPSLPTEFIDKLDMAPAGTGGRYDVNVNPIFQDLKVPKPSVHKGWGEDPSVDDLDRGDEYRTVW